MSTQQPILLPQGDDDAPGATRLPDDDLRHHGDVDAAPGLVDLAVNVRQAPHPAWLRAAIAAADLTRYPEQTAARGAVAAHHHRPAAQVLLTAGSAEAFVLLARTLRPRHAVVVHPQFTEPELALRAAGHVVDRVVLPPPYLLDPALVPADADLVVVGNPTNPTSVLHPAATIRALARPGRTLVVDEAFMDVTPGETQSVSTALDVPGLVVVRSLTKTWALAGLRAGYLLADAATVDALAAAQPHWPVSAPALAATVACMSEAARADVAAWLPRLAADRAHLLAALADAPGVAVQAEPQAPFVLLRAERPELWNPLRDRGFAVRRGDTFPGLDAHHLRVAVRDRTVTDAVVAALTELAA